MLKDIAMPQDWQYDFRPRQGKSPLPGTLR